MVLLMMLGIQNIKQAVFLLIAIFISALLFMFNYKTHIIISEYIELLDDFSSKQLPFSTKIIIHTYRLWLVVPIAALVILLKFINPNAALKPYKYMLILLGLLLLGIFLLLLAVFGMYAPIFALK
ncbi:MAG: hypothetical protein BMS9Abin06_0095 [Gammaproteobacteria bacterium]|nr:MAG: hypothetical protein BMS9Abin06_0095 [Gammaproteobacteria bacterium]